MSSGRTQQASPSAPRGGGAAKESRARLSTPDGSITTLWIGALCSWLRSPPGWPRPCGHTRQSEQREAPLRIALQPTGALGILYARIARSARRRSAGLSPRSLGIEWRYANGDPVLLRAQVAGLVASAPDAIVTRGTPVTQALQQATKTIPIVTGVGDPIGSGFAQTYAQPGGKTSQAFRGPSPKWRQRI